MATLTISQVCGVVVGQEEKPTPSRCDWHVSNGPLGPYILAHGGLTLATPSGLAGKQSWGKVRERGRSEEAAGRIGLPMLRNRPQESWNEVNSMPTHRPDFGVIRGLIWPKWWTEAAGGQLGASSRCIESSSGLFMSWENKSRWLCLLDMNKSETDGLCQTSLSRWSRSAAKMYLQLTFQEVISCLRADMEPGPLGRIYKQPWNMNAVGGLTVIQLQWWHMTIWKWFLSSTDSFVVY